MVDTGPSTALRRLRWVAAGLVGLVAYGVIGYWALEDWTFVDALYMTVITLTTVGYREVRPLDTSGQLFTMSLVLFGVVVLFGGVAMFAVWLAEGDIGGKTRRRRMAKRIDGLRDHYIVCAYGRVGRAAVRELQAADARFVVLDPKEDLKERMDEDGIPYLVEDPSLEPVLREAGVDRAKALLCAVDSDATNVYITLTARQLNPDLFIVARASEPGSVERLERAGADRVVSPYVSSGRHMVRMATDPSIVDLFDETTSLPVVERIVDAGSAWKGRSVAQVDPAVLAVRRADGTLLANPGPEVVLAEGDVVLVLSKDSPG